MITTIIILSLLVILLVYVGFNLLRKLEKCEDVLEIFSNKIENYEKYMSDFTVTIEASDKKLKEIDARGSFEGDDEVGYFFKQLKDLQNLLNNFKVTTNV